ncbi:MAG: hypothetical protein FWF02_03070 [Micrococcales bacterium]|nr:hypothetical protein [Micrococcales bacterium]MCL2666671.1 hypothetical protein [Micrococcales bacterium]
MSQPVPDVVGDPVCSARRCTAEAAWGLLWNNPKLHTPDRRKVWMSCDDHADYLTEFLQLRGFLMSVVEVDDLLATPVSA